VLKDTHEVVIAAAKRIKELTAKVINNNDDGELKKLKFNNNKLINKSMRDAEP